MPAAAEPFRLPKGWLARFGQRAVVIPLAVGVLLLALSGWLFFRPSSFADRAVLTSAVIDDVDEGAVSDAADGLPRWDVYAVVHYKVGSDRVQSRLTVGRCQVTCLFSCRKGDTVQVGYDPRNIHWVVIAEGGHVPKGPGIRWGVVLLAVTGLGFVAAGLINASLP
ncbi:MAG TPA: DUF3592 domain-containing protein [Actinomycetes bacterium]|jgi:hypothetical protein